MAKFGIYSAAGVKKAEGYPTFTGTYMKAGVLDFREIASPIPIDWAVGDYVGYELNGSVVPAYSRTGFKYVLYNIPQVKRQASNGTYGGAFVYQNVQFYDASYDFEISPFRDLVVGDNRVHFSTQPAISVFDDVAGIAERIQACLDDMFPGKWNVQVASGTEYDTLMAEEREFSVSGVNIRGVLDKIYEVWPEVGWIFSVNNNTCTLTIGGAWMNTPDTYVYGKGNGLTGISRTPANLDELANRLYVFGSNRNMLPRWYNNQDIKDAASVDIQHLMLPVDAIPALDYAGWGKTEVSGVDKPDPAKAFIEDIASVAARGLRPKTVYFDGSGDYKEIYPSIEKTTIQDLLDTMASGTEYRPDTSKYPDTSVRVDKVLSVNSAFDSGLAASNGRETVQSEYFNVNASRTHSVTSQQKFSMLLDGGIFAPSETGSMALKFVYELSGTITLTGIKSAYLNVEVRRGASGPIMMNKRVDLEKDESTPNTFIIGNASFTVDKANVTSSDIYLTATIVVEPNSTSVGQTATLSATGTLSFSMERYRARTFNISLRQLGFDISAQANLGDGKTIAMRSGNCVGRSFRIASTAYDSATDTWNVEVIRSNDESLSQWFPNSSYPIVAGDEFVLLDIAMPATYVSVAEKRLLLTARELLSDTAKELWQYNPEIDAKFMANSARSIMPGDIIAITDSDIVEGDGTLNVDSVTINEGESDIPTYKVTIRDKKKKSYSDKASVPEASSTPVTTPSQTVKAGVSNAQDSFFEEDGNGNIKLKDVYGGLWTQGFVTAGGVGSGGGGGGGDLDVNTMYINLANGEGTDPLYYTREINVSHLHEFWKSLQNNDIVSTYNNYKIALAHIPDDDRLSYVDPNAGETITIDDPGTTGTVLWGAESANQVALDVNGVSKTLVKMQALDGIRSSITTILGYFSGGAAYNALALEGHNSSYFATATGLNNLATTVSSLVMVNTIGGKSGTITLGSGLQISNSGELSVVNQTQGTVTRVDVGSTQYNPSAAGVVSLPAYPTALPNAYALTVGNKSYNGSEAVSIDKSDIGLGNVTNDAQVKRIEMGAASGVATLGSDGKIPSSQLPSYVDDVLEYASLSAFPATGESGKIYVALDTNKTYRWSGTTYVEISPSVVIGTTTGTAFDGGSGYSHVTNGDIHVTATQKTNWNTIYGYFSNGVLGLSHIPLDDRLSYVDPEAGEDITIDDPGTTGTVLWGAESANNVALDVNGVSKTLVKQAAMDGVYSSISTLSALIGTKQDYISDLSSIRSNASLGATAYGWGDHRTYGYLTSVPTASAQTLGVVKVGNGLRIDDGVLSVTGQTQGTVTRVDLGSTQYAPDSNGVVGLPAYPTTLPASDVYAWAKEATKPSYAFNEITGTAAESQIPSLPYTKITGLGTAATRGVATTIGPSITNLVPGSLLYSVLGDSFDATNNVKAFINSSIATATAAYRGNYNVVSDLGGHYNDSDATIASEIATKMASLSITPDDNDYCFVEIPTSDESDAPIAVTKRFKYNGTAWGYEYSLNNSGFTQAQWNALNSGITSTLVAAFNAKYDKPVGGIPKEHLDSSVQTSLGLADTALQPAWTGSQNIVTLGTITTGVWHGSAIAQDYLDDIGWVFDRNAATYDTEDYVHVN